MDCLCAISVDLLYASAMACVIDGEILWTFTLEGSSACLVTVFAGAVVITGKCLMAADSLGDMTVCECLVTATQTSVAVDVDVDIEVDVEATNVTYCLAGL